MTIAIIPARGGSKRIPGKNIRTFCGKPIIAYSIQAAIDSGLFDHVIVSTDDEKIADVSQSLGAEVPFIRPVHLSGDYTHTIPVIKHVIEWVCNHLGPVEYACCIYATAPFIQVADLIQGYTSLINSDKEYAFSVTEYRFPIQRAIKINEPGSVECFYPEYALTRSQDLEKAYHDAGQFYWGKASAFCSEKLLFQPHSLPIFLPSYRVQDIDTLEDWYHAEAIWKAINE